MDIAEDPKAQSTYGDTEYIPWFRRSLTRFVGYIAPAQSLFARFVSYMALIFGREPLAAALSEVTVGSSRTLTRIAPVSLKLQVIFVGVGATSRGPRGLHAVLRESRRRHPRFQHFP